MAADLLLELQSLRKVFDVRAAEADHRELVAVDAVSLGIERGSSLAVVGESGSGKTTLARMIVGLETPTSGTVQFKGSLRPSTRGAKARLARARQIQIVFQDPLSSLDPRQTGMQGLDELLKLHYGTPRAERRRAIVELGAKVGLGNRELASLPSQLSGGQRQRLAIMRALVMEPELLVLDEAVSALDVSVQAQILNLLVDLHDELGLTYVFVSHDLAVVRQISEQIIVMKDGKVVESGATDDVLTNPQHPYSQLLRDSVPGPDWRPRRRDRSSFGAAPA